MCIRDSPCVRSRNLVLHVIEYHFFKDYFIYAECSQGPAVFPLLVPGNFIACCFGLLWLIFLCVLDIFKILTQLLL